MRELLVDSFRQEWERLLQWSPRILLAVVVLAASIVAGKLAKRAIDRALRSTDLDAIHAAFIERIAFWLVLMLGGSISLATLGLSAAAGGLLTGGGLIAVVLAFAFREIGENLLAGTLLALRRPFRLGDLIRSGDFEGTVKSIEIRHTHLRTSDGRDIFVPSSMIFKDPLTNYTLDGMRRFSLSIGVDYRSDAENACQLLQRAAASCEGILVDPPPGAWISSLADSWIQIEVTYWVDVFDTSVELTAVRTRLLQACCRVLLDADYTLSAEVSTAVQLTTVP